MFSGKISKRLRVALFLGCLLVVGLPLAVVGIPELAKAYLLRQEGIQSVGYCLLGSSLGGVGDQTGLVECRHVVYQTYTHASDFTFDVNMLVVRTDLKPVIRGGLLKGTADEALSPATAGGPKGSSKELPEIHGVDFEMEFPYGVQLNLQGLEVHNGRACWQKGSISRGAQFRATLLDGCYDLSRKSADLREAAWVLDLAGTPRSGTIRGLRVSFAGPMVFSADYADVADTLQVTGIMGSEENRVLSGTMHPVIQHPWLTLDPGPVDFQVDQGALRISTAFGQVNADLESGFKVPLDLEASCLGLAQALGLPDEFTGRLKASLRWVDGHPDLQVRSGCQLSCKAPRFAGLKSRMAYEAYRADGVTRFTRTTGPTSHSWYPLEGLPRGAAQWWVAMEDPGFWRHQGVLAVALEASLKANLQEGRFARGGSTLTMQLVRNLWLQRDKTLTRKGQEILLSWALERCLSKEEILAWYLNVVEFGPDQYGIAQGAQYHYGVDPVLLEPLEAFYLATIMPSPRKARRGSEAMDLAAKRARRYTASGWLPPDTLKVLGVPAEEGQSPEDPDDD